MILETKKTDYSRKTTLGIFGIGAIGSAMAFYLSSNKKLQLRFFNRSPKEAIKIKYNNINNSFPINCKTKTEHKADLDWLFVCIKEHHFTEAEAFLKDLINPKTKIAVIRNGLRLKEPFLAFTKKENILECIIDCPCQPTKDGFYDIIRDATISIPKGSLADSFAYFFKETLVNIHQLRDFKTTAWKKVCESSALGGLLALHKDSCRIFKNEQTLEQYKRLLAEGIAVAKADGAKIESGFEKEMLEKLLSYPEEKGSSMLTDRLLGRKIELGAKNGLIVEIGRQYGLVVSENEDICMQLKEL